MTIQLDKSRSKADQIYALLKKGKSIDATTAKFIYGISNLPETLCRIRVKFNVPKEDFARTRITLTEALTNLERHGIKVMPNEFDSSNMVSKYRMIKK
jgi:hypothetical protein